MKNIFIVLTLILSIFTNKAQAADFNGTKIHQKIEVQDELYLICDDRTVWELFLFDVREQTWSEWWNNQKVIIKDEFNFDEKSWQVGDFVTISNNQFSDTIAKDFSDADKIKYKSFTKIVKNLHSNKIAFAKGYTFDEFINKIINYANDQYDYGYGRGVKCGYKKGFEDGNISGYQTGYDEGYKTARAK